MLPHQVLHSLALVPISHDGFNLVPIGLDFTIRFPEISKNIRFLAMK